MTMDFGAIFIKYLFLTVNQSPKTLTQQPRGVGRATEYINSIHNHVRVLEEFAGMSAIAPAFTAL